MEGLPVSQILKRAAEKAGFSRTRYEENKVPTTISNIVVFVLFSDVRNSFNVSSLLLKRFREENKGSKYFILCSWPGNEALFPYVDEYWELNTEILKDTNHLRSIYNAADCFRNRHDVIIGSQRVLNTFFEEVLDGSVLESYWHNGFTSEFKGRYKNIKRFLPSISSSNVMGPGFNSKISMHDKKIFLYPAMYLQYWKNGKYQPQLISKKFWEALIGRFLDEGFLPVIYHNFYTHDVSPEFLDKCLYLNNLGLFEVLSAMRSTGCVLDVFTGISRLAIAARCPFVSLQERVAFNLIKDYEIDDLCGSGVPKEYLYIFPSICEEINKSLWNSNLLNAIISRVDALMADLNRDNWPSTLESYEIVPYETVRRLNRKKLGTKFIKIPKC